MKIDMTLVRDIDSKGPRQAIARALELIEGPQVGQCLHDLYQAKLKRTLEGRGELMSDFI